MGETKMDDLWNWLLGISEPYGKPTYLLLKLTEEIDSTGQKSNFKISLLAAAGNYEALGMVFDSKLKDIPDYTG